MLKWEKLASDLKMGHFEPAVWRVKVPGGWLVMIAEWNIESNLRAVDVATSMTFIPDPEHEWDGDSLD